jgi:hypothetical protein
VLKRLTRVCGNAIRYIVDVEVLIVLNTPVQIWSTMTVWLLVALRLDSLNIRAVRPFPAAPRRWEWV